MKIRTELLGRLGELAGVRETHLELPEASTIRQLLHELEKRFPNLRPVRQELRFTADFDLVSEDHPIGPSETVTLFLAGEEAS